MEFNHYSVLLGETIENLNVRPGGIYVDGTLGGGGHAYEVCKRLNGQGRFIGIDQDADAIKAASERLSEYGDLVTIVRSNYCNMKQVLNDLGIEKVDGIVLDLGVKSGIERMSNALMPLLFVILLVLCGVWLLPSRILNKFARLLNLV